MKADREFLLTNGLGGYVLSTRAQVPCRKYHSAYTVSLSPPTRRLHMVSHLQETVFCEGQHREGQHRAGQRLDLTGVLERTAPDAGGGRPSEALLEGQFSQRGCAEFRTQLPCGSVEKRMAFAYGTHALAICYTFDITEDVTFELTPWIHFRDHHDVAPMRLEDYSAQYASDSGVLVVERHVGDGTFQKLYIQVQCSGGAVAFQDRRELSPETVYPLETERGYPDAEAHGIFGGFQVAMKPGHHTLELVVNTEPVRRSAVEILEGAELRYTHLMGRACPSGRYRDFEAQLIWSADSFIVSRASTGKKSIVAGYPWFTDWGRDAMIALEGLTLETGRHAEALDIIEGFLNASKDGLIPNTFPDAGEMPMYNTCDATLWLIHAAHRYFERTGDSFGISQIYPQLEYAMLAHAEGYSQHIRMDADGLLMAGNADTQLTWMDVKVDGWVVTPRHGKSVEINALWYNALCCMHALNAALKTASHTYPLSLQGILEAPALDYAGLAAQVKTSFNDQFWNAASGCLYDGIMDGCPVETPRPNMIFAVSLPFPVLEQARWRSVVDYVASAFKIPYGLLTLRSTDPEFQPHYTGTVLQRDGAYHRGTAWAWLLGPYLEAHYRAYADTAYLEAALDAVLDAVEDGVYGSVAEIFEGAPPHAKKGCPAQAWSVAEVLRSMRLYDRATSRKDAETDSGTDAGTEAGTEAGTDSKHKERT